MTATAKAAPRRAELLDVAISLFYEKGYAHTTLQDIADRMGFTKAAIYYYAKNKEELLVEIYTAIVEPAIANARELAAQPARDGAAQFVALIEQHLQTFLHNVEANAVFEVQNFSLSDPAKRRIQALGREYNDVLLSVYEAGIADGSISDANPKIAVNAIIGMCNSAHRWYRPRGRVATNQVIAQLVGLVESGIRPPSGD
jgi:TetR/AcrR family transcriptional regulator, cholesterol catabolism regulator